MCKLILGHSLSLHSIECKLIGYEFPLGKLICRQTIFSFCTDNFLFLYDIFCTEWGEIREFWKNPWVYIEFTKLTLSSEWTQTQYWVHMWVYLGKLDSLDVSRVQWHNSWVCCRSGIYMTFWCWQWLTLPLKRYKKNWRIFQFFTVFIFNTSNVQGMY